MLSPLSRRALPGGAEPLFRGRPPGRPSRCPDFVASRRLHVGRVVNLRPIVNRPAAGPRKGL